MPQVNELYGLPLRESGAKRAASRQAFCPHMMKLCDGGGNRDMARWPANEQPLAPLFDPSVGEQGGGFIPCGVCSVRLTTGRNTDTYVDWAVCPRRLLSFESGAFSDSQHALAERVLQVAGFERGDQIRIWSEIRLLDRSVGVDYRMDYVLRKNDNPPVIVEVMTASTSGGNRRRRTDIQSAFSDAVLYENGLIPELRQSPGVNARQVWARMLSQMIVKSEITNQWGGRTIWVVQDSLCHYIKRSTGLNLDALRSTDWEPGEVNLISASINDPEDIELYSGPIRPGDGTETCWLELPTSPGIPPVEKLTDHLTNESAIALLTV